MSMVAVLFLVVLLVVGVYWIGFLCVCARGGFYGV